MGPRELARIERLNGLFAGVLILAAVVFFPERVAIGVAVGALLAVANFYGMRKLVVASLRRQGSGRAALQLLLIAKMGVLFFLVFLAIRFLPLSPVGLAVGLSVFLLSIAVESLRHALGHGGPEAPTHQRVNGAGRSPADGGGCDFEASAASRAEARPAK